MARRFKELLFAVQDRFSKGNKDVRENENRITLKSTVRQMADGLFENDPNLQSVTFEIESQFVPYIDSIFEDNLINDNYIVNQVGADQVELVLRELDI